MGEQEPAALLGFAEEDEKLGFGGRSIVVVVVVVWLQRR
jgi:hypothetical protein